MNYLFATILIALAASSDPQNNNESCANGAHDPACVIYIPEQAEFDCETLAAANGITLVPLKVNGNEVCGQVENYRDGDEICMNFANRPTHSNQCTRCRFGTIDILGESDLLCSPPPVASGVANWEELNMCMCDPRYDNNCVTCTRGDRHGMAACDGTTPPQVAGVACDTRFVGAFTHSSETAVGSTIDLQTYELPTCVDYYDCVVKIAEDLGQVAFREYLPRDLDCVDGVCGCPAGYAFNAHGTCSQWTCNAATSGSACKDCVPVEERTKNDHCSECNTNQGYILVDGNCVYLSCTENPDEIGYQGCEHCRSVVRHPEDCLNCAHGWHFSIQEKGLIGVDYAESGETTGLKDHMVMTQQSGYCFPYQCVAGGNLEVDVDYFGRDQPSYRVVKYTAIVVTEDGPNQDTSVPKLSADVLAFRDHCKTCVPQYERVQDDHCATCNPGYYLDEMHHSCRRKTCGVPHFRRNAVTCYEDANGNKLAPKPWSTPCMDCLDNSTDECCLAVDPQLFCGAQDVVCHPGTENDNFESIACGENCVNYAAPCCGAKTCHNQQVGCFPDQDRNAVDADCGDNCYDGSLTCCTLKVSTCAAKNVECGPLQDKRDGSTPCTRCQDEGHECCEPLRKTCGNQGVLCHMGTALDVDATCPAEGCEHYSQPCCGQKTCVNQRVHCTEGRTLKTEQNCDLCLDDTLECCNPAPPIQETCGNQLVTCGEGLYRPGYVECSQKDGTCNNDGLTCCYAKTCGNQNVKCGVLQKYVDSQKVCTTCLDHDETECCADARTCGTVGVLCEFGFYMPPETPCTSCDHFNTNECCTDVVKTCANQGVICLPGTAKPLGTGCTDCIHYGDDCCVKTTCDNQQVACSPGRPRKVATADDPLLCDNCVHDSDECCEPLVRTCGNQHIRCHDGHYLNQNLVCGENCVNYANPCCEVYTTTCGSENVVCGVDQNPKAPTTVCVTCANRATGEGECCEAKQKTCKNQDVKCMAGHYDDNYNTKHCTTCLNDDVTECCTAFQKTCGNQNVQCGYGLATRAQKGVFADIACNDCDNFTSVDCCEPVAKTCGNQGVQCRSDLYNPSSTPCGEGDAGACTHNSQPCCQDPPVTCGSSSHVCANGHYKPASVVCETGACNDDLCCHASTCGNMNVKCAVGTHRDPTTTCGVNCVNYGTTCCEQNTCENARVTCDIHLYNHKPEGSTCNKCLNDGTECCEPKALQNKAGTCDNKHGVTENDVALNPFLDHFLNIMVACDEAAGYQYRTDGSGQLRAAIPCSDGGLQPGAEKCTTNDPDCCWRKSCAPGDGENSGQTEDFDTEFDCEAHGMDLVANADQVNCHEDCLAVCCVPKKTCLNERVACSAGFRRVSNYNNAVCETDAGQDCVENSASCCEATTCTSEGVTCSGEVEAKAGNPTCLNCMNDGVECCQPVQKTCLNQRVHCGFGFHKKGLYNELTCTDCLNDGSDCCNANTCESRGSLNVAVVCDGVNFAHVEDTRKQCYHCVDNGAECCVPIIPDTTCRNQNVQCNDGYIHKADLDAVCVGCDTNDDVCCHQKTCENPDGLGKEGVVCGPEFTHNGDVPCTSCLPNGVECCTRKEVHTCWSDKIVCPNDRYHKHPNLVCDGECTVEVCCAIKTCENQGVCCNNRLGFSEKANLADVTCTNCADNCEECCSFDTPTCDSANVGCGFGYHRKLDQSVPCDTCAHNDAACCEPRTCGADGDIDTAFVCDPATHSAVPPETKCHFCGVKECCVPLVPPETCGSEQVGCGHGFERRTDIDRDTHECDTCALNDLECCVATTCADVQCGDGRTTRGADRLCGFCTVEECCTVDQTCDTANVGCGFGMAVKPNSADDACVTCALNDDACCVAQTCGTHMALKGGCPANYEDADPNKSCAFCELAECCVPVEPKHTCEYMDVGCGYGFARIDHPEGDAAPACGTCELNDPVCCASKHCSDRTCPEGTQHKTTVDQCGFCSVEECCEPIKTCQTEQVGCGFGYDYVTDPTTTCGTCTHNDSRCCVQRTCQVNGPDCGTIVEDGHAFTPVALDDTPYPCAFCNKRECCVPPVVPRTCDNQEVACTAGTRRLSNYVGKSCTDCSQNGPDCCEATTCGNSGVTCDLDLFTKVAGFATKPCLACANNALECCEPKLCGHHFLDLENSCPSDTHSTNPRNTPCVDCDQKECCRPLPTLRCTEVEIPNGQAFYTAPSGEGSERMMGSVLYVECDLGYKFEDREYKFTGDVSRPDQSVEVDYPVCRNPPREELHETNVIMFSPTTSGWDRAPPVCRPVTCPVLQVESKYCPNAESQEIGRVIYRDAQMDENPNRGFGYNQRDYAAEADVVCNEGWIRVPNLCVDELAGVTDNMSENTLEWALKGFWRFEDNAEDSAPHCNESRDTRNEGSCNDAELVGAPNYVEGATMDGAAGRALKFDGNTQYVHVEDEWNYNWGSTAQDNNELDIDSDSWTASLFVKLDAPSKEHDGYLFARYNEHREEVVALKLSNGRVNVIYNNGEEDPRDPNELPADVWNSVIARHDNGVVDLFVNGVLVNSAERRRSILDTSFGSVYVGADKEGSDKVNNFVDGIIDEVRWYSRGLTNKEIGCLADGQTNCPRGIYYAKPYNTQGCNRDSEEIKTAEACKAAVENLLKDGILGNSLNGGERFGSDLEDVQLASGAQDTPTYCSYREEDNQVIFSPNPNGRAHTSLAPICSRTPQSEPDMSEVGCLPKCLENGEWSVALPTCEKDWCHPIHEEWSCCHNRAEENISVDDDNDPNNGKSYLGMDYYLKHHDQLEAKCPIGYGDCDHDDECIAKPGKYEGVCGQRRDLDNIDVCIIDLDPCYNHKDEFVSGTMCSVVTAVGVNYDEAVASGTASRIFIGGSVLIFGVLAGYHMCKTAKGDEYKHLLEEEL